MGTILCPKFMTGASFQVKNDGSFTDNATITLFTLMNPFHVGLFLGDDEKLPTLPPVLRIVFALASNKSAVTGPQISVRHSPRLELKKTKKKSKNPEKESKNTEKEFTAYNVWIAGVSDQSFGVIPDEETHTQYKLLLDRTCNVFNNYGALTKGKFEKEEQSRIDVRCMMHAGAASGKQHHQNYFSNLTRAPRAPAYVVIEGSMEVDQSESNAEHEPLSPDEMDESEV